MQTEPLRHAEQMTRHRDQSLVDSALVNSLTDLIGRGRRRVSVTIYRTEKDADILHVTQTAWSDGRESDHNEYVCEFSGLPAAMKAALSLHVVHTDTRREKGRPLHGCWFPVLTGDRLLACVEIRVSRALGMRHLPMIHGMLGLYRNYLSLLDYSQHDSLTGLLNRKTFDDNLDKILLRARHAQTIAAIERRQENHQSDNWLAILDIDHFKQINDHYGHVFGDEVLILLARLMRKVFRRHDKLFRFGGEEFVVIAQRTSEANAQKLFNRLRTAVENHAIPQVGHIAVSIGFTQLLPGDTATEVLGRADDALYYAKQHGRNQVHQYEILVASGNVKPAAFNCHAELF